MLSFEGGDVLLPLNAGSRSLVALGATQNTGTHAHQRRGSAPRFPAITAFSEPIEPQRVWTHGGAPSLARIRYVNFGVSPRKQSLVLPHPASSYRHSNLSRPGQSLPSNRTGFHEHHHVDLPRSSRRACRPKRNSVNKLRYAKLSISTWEARCSCRLEGASNPSLVSIRTRAAGACEYHTSRPECIAIAAIHRM